MYLYNHGKCQELGEGRDPRSLVAAFLRYLRKYYPTPRLHQRMLLVTSCTPTFALLTATLATQPEAKHTFDMYFHRWIDLATIAARTSMSPDSPTLRAVQFKRGRTKHLLSRLRHPAPVTTTDTVLMMKEVVDEILPGVGQFDSSRLLALSSPCSLPSASYLIVLLHIGLLEKEDGRPLLGTIGFRNNQRGSWFVPLDPGRSRGTTAASARSLGFVMLKEKWSWGEEGSLACLDEAEALLCFISALTAEKANCGATSVVLVMARRNEKVLGALVAALTRSGHLPAFLQLVSGLGDLEGLCTRRGLSLTTPGLAPLSTYFQQTTGRPLDLTKAEGLPKGLYQVLESLVGGPPNYDNFISPHLHPILSPYTNSLLLASKVDHHFSYHSQPITGS